MRQATKAKGTIQGIEGFILKRTYIAVKPTRKNIVLEAWIVPKALMDAPNFQIPGESSRPSILAGACGLRPKAKSVWPKPMVSATLTVKPSKTAFGMNMQYSWRRSKIVRVIMHPDIKESHGRTSAPYVAVKRMRMPTSAPAGPTILKAESPKLPLTRPPTMAVAIAVIGVVPVAMPRAKLRGTATNVTVAAGSTLGRITWGNDSIPFKVLTLNILPGPRMSLGV
mmetsp:Transcript_89889/g.254252  ORF Transcript_89889/g.254252 Transcript_89889/m.254252 type:complete len:225 (-) Transcript_89889:225-899(-)